MGEAYQMLPTSIQMDKVQGVLVEILNSYSNIGTFKRTACPSQKQLGDIDGGNHATPSSQDDGLFMSDPSF